MALPRAMDYRLSVGSGRRAGLASAVALAVVCVPAPAFAAWQRLPDLSATGTVDRLDLSSVDVEVSRSGAAVAAWNQRTGTATRVVVAERHGPGRFGAARQIPDSDGLFPKLALWGEREAIVAWSLRGEGEENGVAATFRARGDAFGPVSVLRPLGSSSYLRGLGYDRRGTLWLWVTETDERLLARGRDGTLSEHALPPGAIEPDDALNEPLALEAGGGLTFFRTLRGGVLGVQRRDPAGRLSPVRSLSRFVCNDSDEEPACSLGATRVGVAAGGDALAAWCSSPTLTGTLRVSVAQRRRTGAFGAVRRLGGPGACDPSADMGERGDGVLSWTRRGRLYAVLRSRAGSLGRAQFLGVPGDEGQREVAISPAGHAVALWEERGNRLRAAVRRPGRRFGPARTIATDLDPVKDWRMGIDGAGRAVVTYLARRAPRVNTVRAVSYTP